MSCELLTHPSISIYIWAIWLGLVGCLLSLPLQSTLLQSSHGFCSISFPYCPHIQNFQHHFSALILFGGNWGAEIARTSCADLFTFKWWMIMQLSKAFDRSLNKQIVFAPVMWLGQIFWSNFAFAYCSKRHKNVKKLMSLFSKCVLIFIHKTKHC